MRITDRCYDSNNFRQSIPLDSFLVVLVLTAAILHASWNALVKKGGTPEYSVAAYQLVGAVICICLLPFVPLPDGSSWPFILASVIVHNLYYLAMAQAYRAGDLSQVYPLFRGLAPGLVAIAAAVFAHEWLSAGTVLGLVLVSTGLMSITLFGGGKIPPMALRWGLITSALIATYTIIDGLGVRRSGNSLSYILWLFVLEIIPIGCWLLVYRRQQWFSYMNNARTSVLFGGIASSLAYGLVIFAMSLGAMAVVSSLRETSVIFAALIGTLILGEPFGRQRVIAAVLVGSGIIIMRLLQ
jgi:drug/metabolite transporter (DMT)-like permease